MVDRSLIIYKAPPVSKSFKHHLADCVILTHDNHILLQRRPENWGAHAGAHNIFGGHVEEGETVIEGLIRELCEELGAVIQAEDVQYIATLTEAFTNHSEAVHIHFWHDKDNVITGCYEAEAVYFKTLDEALSAPLLMEYAEWALRECAKRGLLPQ